MDKLIRLSYLGMVSSYYSYVDVEETDLTTGLSGERVFLGPTRQLLTHWSSDSENNSKTNYDLLTYTDTARLISLDDALKADDDEDTSGDEETEEEDKSFEADEYPIVGMAHAQTYSYDGTEKLENNVLVCGGMMLADSSFLSNASLANEDVLLGSVNTLTGNENAIVISGKVVQTDTMTLTESTIMTMMVIFVVVIPVLTLVICLVVFIKRRHL